VRIKTSVSSCIIIFMTIKFNILVRTCWPMVSTGKMNIELFTQPQKTESSLNSVNMTFALKRVETKIWKMVARPTHVLKWSSIVTSRQQILNKDCDKWYRHYQWQQRHRLAEMADFYQKEWRQLPVIQPNSTTDNHHSEISQQLPAMPIQYNYRLP